MPPPNPHELWLLKLILMNDDLVPWVAAHVNPDWIHHGLVKDIIKRRLEADAQKTWSSVAEFLGGVESDSARNLVLDATMENRPILNPAGELAAVILKLRNLAIDREKAHLMFQLNQPEQSEAKKQEFMKKDTDLNSQKREPLRPL
jgi:hypothetical protein